MRFGSAAATENLSKSSSQFLLHICLHVHLSDFSLLVIPHGLSHEQKMYNCGMHENDSVSLGTSRVLL